ncbi:hypothetical protein [Nocardia flavorosea]|uniref:Uncharacterized protein n=1 Tax=Nocardia flavorosea TaxID=53429 RepID=A0A846YMG9_9NOCA|nr:hypothetical protein [Nocardia flavorosea]NKY58458.1 hypothetical protein [Nocardia flavorosea]
MAEAAVAGVAAAEVAAVVVGVAAVVVVEPTGPFDDLAAGPWRHPDRYRAPGASARFSPDKS